MGFHVSLHYVPPKSSFEDVLLLLLLLLDVLLYVLY